MIRWVSLDMKLLTKILSVLMSEIGRTSCGRVLSLPSFGIRVIGALKEAGWGRSLGCQLSVRDLYASKKYVASVFLMVL